MNTKLRNALCNIDIFRYNPNMFFTYKMLGEHYKYKDNTTLVSRNVRNTLQ